MQFCFACAGGGHFAAQPGALRLGVCLGLGLRALLLSSNLRFEPWASGLGSWALDLDLRVLKIMPAAWSLGFQSFGWDFGLGLNLELGPMGLRSWGLDLESHSSNLKFRALGFWFGFSIVGLGSCILDPELHVLGLGLGHWFARVLGVGP